MSDKLEEMESIRLQELRDHLNPLKHTSPKEAHGKVISLRLKKRGLASILREAMGADDYKDMSSQFKIGRS